MGIKVQPYRNKWRVVIHHARRRWVKTFATEAEANRFADKLRVQMELHDEAALKRIRKRIRPVPTLKSFAARWIQEIGKSRRKETTIGRYKSCLNTHLVPELGRVRLNEIDYAMLKELCIAKAQVLSRDSVRNMMATLRALIKEAVREKYLKENPVQDLAEFYGQARKPTDEDAAPFDREELELLCTTARERHPVYYEFIFTAARTGMRFGELRALYVDDLDFRHRKIHVRRNWPALAKNLTTTKTNKQRQVDMTPDLKVVLRDMLARRREQYLADGRPSIPKWLLLSPKGHLISYSNFAHRCWYPLTERLRAKHKIRKRDFHNLRHTYATLLLMADVNPLYVSKQLGHSRPTTTLDRYAHWIPDYEETRQADVLDNKANLEVEQKGPLNK